MLVVPKIRNNMQFYFVIGPYSEIKKLDNKSYTNLISKKSDVNK